MREKNKNIRLADCHERTKDMLDLHRLKIFKRVAEMKSYSLAARELYLTQPTVSQHIAQLEDYIGLKVFDRTSREVLLTRAGEILYKFAKK